MVKFSSAQKSFLIQYLSIILIILSFLVASSNGRHQPKIEVHSPASAPAIKNKTLKSQLVFGNIFVGNTDSINFTELEPLKELIENHNIDLKLVIATPNKAGAKVAKLSKVLREHGFWKDSFSVLGQVEPKSDLTTVTAHFEWSQL